MKVMYNLYLEGKYQQSQELDIDEPDVPYMITSENGEMEWILTNEDENFI